MTMLDDDHPMSDLDSIRDSRGSVGPWFDVCHIDDLIPERGVGALIGETQIAIFPMRDGELFALDNRDPFSTLNVLSRGLTGTAGDTPTVASPVYKQRFDLRTGRCLDDASVRLRVYRIRRDGERVLVQMPQTLQQGDPHLAATLA